MHPPAAEAATGVYDLFMTTNLSPNVPGLNLTNWLWLLRTDPGETNLAVPGLPQDQAFFRLAQTNDTDADGMTDAYEHLVSHTSLTNADTPIITSQPLSQTIYARDSVTFTVSAEGPPNLTYQWLFNGTNMPGKTNTSLTILNAQEPQAGDYSVHVASPAGLSAVSSNATLTVCDSTDLAFIPVTGPRQDYTFKRGATYLIYSPVQVWGRTVIQGGTVIKFDNSTNSSLQVKGSLLTEASVYFPGILTSIEDDSVGTPIWGGPASLLTATNGCAYLDLTSAERVSSEVSYLWFGYADQALTTPGPWGGWTFGIASSFDVLPPSPWVIGRAWAFITSSWPAAGRRARLNEFRRHRGRACHRRHYELLGRPVRPQSIPHQQCRAGHPLGRRFRALV